MTQLATKANMCCPLCKTIAPCPVVKSEGNKKFIDHPDVIFRSRRRVCSQCRQKFTTYEVTHEAVDEIVNSRSEIKKLLQENRKLQRKIIIAQEYLHRLQEKLSK